jgi:flagellar basal-body rod protein FlgB
MDFNNLAIFRMARTKLDYVAQRQTLLAENIANADTPNYKVKDLRELDFRQMALNAYKPTVRQSVTQEGHVQAAVSDEGPFQVNTPRHTWETSLDGNKVVLEEQVEKMSRGRSEYGLALNLIKKNMQMLKAALGRNSG